MKTLYKKMQQLNEAGETYEIKVWLKAGDHEISGPVLTYTDDSVVIDKGRPGHQSELHIPFSNIGWAKLIIGE